MYCWERESTLISTNDSCFVFRVSNDGREENKSGSILYRWYTYGRNCDSKLAKRTIVKLRCNVIDLEDADKLTPRCTLEINSTKLLPTIIIRIGL